MLYFIRCITPKRVTSLRTNIRVIPLALNTAPFKDSGNFAFGKIEKQII